MKVIYSYYIYKQQALYEEIKFFYEKKYPISTQKMIIFELKGKIIKKKYTYTNKGVSIIYLSSYAYKNSNDEWCFYESEVDKQYLHLYERAPEVLQELCRKNYRKDAKKRYLNSLKENSKA